jgi:23S rRNA pseudouridine1911/1915/1917 synthase
VTTDTSASSAPEGFYALSGRACAWPRRIKQGPVRMIAPEELRAWIVHDDARLLVVNKPGDVVCHPSKDGPWSSLASAVREFARLESAHLIFRLDRETSGLVVFAKDATLASRLQRAVQARRVAKAYVAIMTGALREPVTVNEPLGDDVGSPVFVKSTVRADGQPAISHFTPLAMAGGFTLARVVTETGRKHQIRAHAQWLGHSLVGDKIYGPDARLYLDFIDHGWTEALAARLLLPRQALHCAEIDLRPAGLPDNFRAELPADMKEFCVTRGLEIDAARE